MLSYSEGNLKKKKSAKQALEKKIQGLLFSFKLSLTIVEFITENSDKFS